MRLPVESIFVDLRPGGTFRYTLVNEATGERFPTAGVYLEVVEPKRLVFTWGEPGKSPDEAPLVTLTFVETAGVTEMTFRLERAFGRPGDGDIHDGWSEAFDNLADHVARHGT